MVVTAGSIVHDTIIRLAQLIASGVTDPISGSRSAKSKFVTFSFPDHDVQYPLITIQGRIISDTRLGVPSQNMRTDVAVEARVWSKSTTQRDGLADKIYETVVSNQSNSASGTEAFGLYDLRTLRQVNIDEPGKEGVHSKVQEFAYFVTI